MVVPRCRRTLSRLLLYAVGFCQENYRLSLQQHSAHIAWSRSRGSSVQCPSWDAVSHIIGRDNYQKASSFAQGSKRMLFVWNIGTASRRVASCIRRGCIMHEPFSDKVSRRTNRASLIGSKTLDAESPAGVSQSVAFPSRRKWSSGRLNISTSFIIVIRFPQIDFSGRVDSIRSGPVAWLTKQRMVSQPTESWPGPGHHTG